MKRRLDELMNISQISNAPLPGVPLIEIVDNRRVLIENHSGMIAYEKTKICVKVGCGHIEVNGNDLILAKMSSDQLIINGIIRDVILQYNRR